MNYTRFLGPSENYSPLTILKELDRLLLLNNWTRVGVNPTTLDSYYANTNTSPDYNNRTGAFGYKHGASGEVLWFIFTGHWHKSGSNYESVFGLLWSLQATYSAAAPESILHFSAVYTDTTHNNETADWHVGVGKDGFYVIQGLGDKPSGLCLERTTDGRWLAQAFDNQSRYYSTSGLTSVQPVGTNTNTNTWVNLPMQATVVQLANNKLARVGNASVLELTFVQDNTSGAAQTPDGTVQRGFWYQVNNYTPLTSSFVTRFFDPGSNTSLQVDTQLRIYRKLTNNTSGNTYPMSNLSWRVQ